MKHIVVYYLLYTLKLFDCMGGGENGVGLADIVFWSGVKRSTAYRYLLQLEKEKLVYRASKGKGRKGSTYWHISQRGAKQIQDAKPHGW